MDAPSTSTAATTANSASAQKPKIDPLQLLKCLSILLNPRGGIRGETEVQRVKGLMAKYSKKLVSKCIYLNILQATDLPLIDLFYEEGGWELVGVWLQEAVNAKNWPLATQVLSLLESSPMTVARLKRNTTPKLVKELSKDSSSPGVQVVAKHLVLKWMEVVRQGDGVATAAGVGLDSSINTSADEDSVETPIQQAEIPTTQQAEIPTTRQAEIPTTRQAEIPTTQQAEIPNEQTSMDVDGVAEEGTHTATAESSQGEGGYGSSSLSCQDESSSTSTESDITPAPTTPIRITIRSGSQVLAKVSSQRLSQDSTDSDDNKPLSIIKQEAEKARSSTPVSGGAISNENSSTTSVGSLETGDDTSGNTTAAAAAAGSLEAGNAALENIESTSGSNVNSVIVNTSAVTVSSTVPSTESTTTTTTTSAIHTIVTFTGSLAANNPPVAKSSPASTQSNTTSPLPDTKDQDSPVTEKKSDMNGVSDDTKVESVTSKGANKVDSGNKSEGKSETKSEVKSEKVKKSDSSKDKAKDKHRDKDKEREKDRKSRDHDRKKDKDKSKSSKTSGSSSSSSSSSSSKSDKDRVKSSKDHDRSKSDKHRSSSTKDKDRRDKDRSKSSRDKRSGSTDKDKHREKERDKDKERREDKKKKEQENEDKATLEKIKPLSADGLAKIPRKQAPASFLDALGSADVDLQEAKKPTVKTYKSRGFRNTGLLDEPTKLPGVAGKKASEKKPAAGVSLAGGMKRTSPLDDLAATPPDKRTRSSVSSLPLNADKPGGVKLISPKRPSLSDDGGFMAALTAAGTETRKKVTRKRKSSESDPKGEVKEEEGGSPSASPAKIEDKSVILSPTSVRPTFNFYQETLKDYDDEDEDAKSENDVAERTEGSEEMEVGDTEAENEDSDKQNENQEEDVEMKNEGAEDDPRTINMDVDESEAKDEYVQPGGGEGGGDGSDGDAGKEAEIPHAPAVPAPAQEDYEKVEVTFSLPNPSIRSVLVYHRPATRKKKAVKWKTEDDLKEVFYFELDETERVNVNSIKFNELMVMEKQREREAMGKGRALHGNMGLLGGSISSFGGMGNAGDEHMMGGLGMQHNMTNVQEFMRWSLLPVMLTGQPNISPGCRSQERVIQAARESSTMAAFFHPAILPDSPCEPDPELVVRVEPKEVPLLDISGQDNIHDHRNKLWPEPVINEPMNYGYGGMGAMGNMGGMSGGSSAGGGSHWVIGGPPSGGFAGGPMYGGPGGPGGLNGPGGYGGPGHGNFGGDMGGGMDGPSWGGPGPDFPNPNMMMGSGGPGMMMGARPNMAPRGMMSNMGMGGPRFRGRGGWGGPRSGPPACKHFMNGHCRHGKNCKFLHLKQY